MPEATYEPLVEATYEPLKEATFEPIASPSLDASIPYPSSIDTRPTNEELRQAEDADAAWRAQAIPIGDRGPIEELNRPLVNIPTVTKEDMIAAGLNPKLAAVVAGLNQGAGNFASGMTSPLGALTVGAGALPEGGVKLVTTEFGRPFIREIPQVASRLRTAAPRIVSGTFAGQAAAALPEQAGRFGTALGEGDVEGAVREGVGLFGSGAIARAAGGHALSGDVPVEARYDRDAAIPNTPMRDTPARIEPALQFQEPPKVRMRPNFGEEIPLEKGEPKAIETRPVENGVPIERQGIDEGGTQAEASAGDSLPSAAHEQAAPETVKDTTETFSPPVNPPENQNIPSTADQPEVHSIKNAWTDEARKAEGLQPATVPERRDFQQVLNTALEELARDKDAGINLVEELSRNPRAVTDTEDALILNRQVEVKNRLDALTDEFNKATEDGNTSLAEDIRGRRAVLRDEYLKVLDAARNAGTATARGLNARKILVRSDFSLERMVAEERANANDGAPLTQEQNARVEAEHEAIKANNAELAQREAAAVEGNAYLTAQRELESQVAEKTKVESRRTPKEKTERTKKVVAFIDSQLDAARSRIRARQTEVHASVLGLSPEDLADHAIIGASYIAKGAVKFVDFSARMRDELGERIKPHLEKIFQASRDKLREFSVASGDRDLAAELKSMSEGVKEAAQDADGGQIEKSLLRRYAVKIADNLIESGIHNLDKLVDALHPILKEAVPEITRREVMDAFSGSGDYQPLDMDAVKVKRRDLQQQGQAVAKLENLEARKPLPRSGYGRQDKSDEARRLEQKVNAAKKEFGVVVTDPERQLKSALDAIKSRLKNSISDKKFEIATRKRIVREKHTVADDAEATKLRSELAELKRQHDEIFTKEPLTDHQRVQIALKAAVRAESEALDKIARKDFGPAKSRTIPSTPELDAARSKRDAAKAELQELRNADESYMAHQDALKLKAEKAALEKSIAEKEAKLASGDTEPKGKQVDRPDTRSEIEKLKQTRDAKAKELSEMRKKANQPTEIERIQKEVAKINKQIADKEAQIKSGKFDEPKGATQNRPQVEEIEKAKLRLEEVNRQIDEIKHPKRTPEEIARQTLKTRLLRRGAQLDERIAKGDFGPRVKRTPVKTDPEIEAIRANTKRSEKTFLTRQKEYERRNRGKWEKRFDFVSDIRRMSVLSGVGTLVKLAAYTPLKIAAMLGSEVAGSAIQRIPGLNKIAARANIEGRSNVPALFKAIAKGMTKGIDDAVKTWTKGESDLKAQYSDRIPEPKEWVHFFQILHEVIKSPLRRVAFEFSLEKQLQHAAENRIDTSNPLVKAAIFKDAYLESDRALLLENNKLSSGIRGIFKRYEAIDPKTGRPSFGGKAIATAGRVEFPITTVPLNFTKQALVSAFGLITGSVHAVAALKRGVETLHPDEANQILRHLKYGSVGGALVLYGFYDGWNNGANGTFGGYYQPGEKRKENQAGVGGLRIGNQNIGGILLHNPVLAAGQLGHTMGAIAHKVFTKDHSIAEGVTVGTVAGLFGLLHDSPLGQQSDILTQLGEGRTARKAIGNVLRSHLEPTLVQEAAKRLDFAPGGNVITGPFAQRNPVTIGQNLKSGLPILRKDVPKNK